MVRSKSDRQEIRKATQNMLDAAAKRLFPGLQMYVSVNEALGQLEGLKGHIDVVLAMMHNIPVVDRGNVQFRPSHVPHQQNPSQNKDQVKKLEVIERPSVSSPAVKVVPVRDQFTRDSRYGRTLIAVISQGDKGVSTRELAKDLEMKLNRASAIVSELYRSKKLLTRTKVQRPGKAPLYLYKAVKGAEGYLRAPAENSWSLVNEETRQEKVG